MKPETALGYAAIILMVVICPPLIIPVLLALFSGSNSD